MKSLNNKKDWKFWLKIIIVLLVVIFLLIGFLIGYFYDDKSCIENPLTYGIKKMNEFNDDNLSCRCSSYLGKIKPFSFDEDGFNDNFFG